MALSSEMPPCLHPCRSAPTATRPSCAALPAARTGVSADERAADAMEYVAHQLYHVRRALERLALAAEQPIEPR